MERPPDTTATAAASPAPPTDLRPLEQPGTRLFSSRQVFAGTLLGNPIAGALMIWLNQRAFARGGGATLIGIAVLSTLAIGVLTGASDLSLNDELIVYAGANIAWGLGFARWSSPRFDAFTRLRMNRRSFVAVFNAWLAGTVLMMLVAVVVGIVWTLATPGALAPY